NIKNNATGAGRSSTTNDQGRYSFGLLEPGSYSLTIEGTGFKKALATEVTVSVSNETQMSTVLEIGAPTETVTVTSTQEVINTTSPTLTNVINTKQVQDLPIGSRNPLELAALQAGIAVIGTGTRTASVAGLRGSATNVTQDGINAMDNFVKTDSFFARTAPSLGSTSEFSITTGTVDSSAGRGAAQVNIVTKGGTNNYHGSLFYLMRNSALEANSWFNNFNGIPRPDEHQHFYGGTIGGPVHFLNFGEGVPKHWSGKDRAFFFFSYEAFREKFQSTRSRTVLTQSARTGVFTYVGTDGATRTVNMLPLGNFHTLNPISTAQLNAMPLPNAQGGDNLNTGGLRFNIVGTDPSDSYVGRYDHQLVKDTRFGSHKVEFVYSHTQTSLFPDTFNSIEAPFPGGVNAGQASPRVIYTGALVSQFGSLSNVFRYGRQFGPVAFLRESLATAPYLVFGSPVSNYDNTFQNQGRETTVRTFSDNMALPKGSHLLKFGADWEQVYAVTFNDAGINKTITLGTNGSNPDGLLKASFQSISDADFALAQQIYRDLTGTLASASATFNVQTATSGFVPGYTRE
ncbi:MAG: carboxypeptidase-like regulatory domain-containing protein, partial [Acidobacteriota bacterium]